MFQTMIVANLIPLQKMFLIEFLGIFSDDDAEMLAGEYEGDMILTDEQIALLDSRTGRLNTKYRWPNNIVPYYINGTFSKVQLAHYTYLD